MLSDLSRSVLVGEKHTVVRDRAVVQHQIWVAAADSELPKSPVCMLGDSVGHCARLPVISSGFPCRLVSCRINAKNEMHLNCITYKTCVYVATAIAGSNRRQLTDASEPASPSTRVSRSPPGRGEVLARPLPQTTRGWQVAGTAARSAAPRTPAPARGRAGGGRWLGADGASATALRTRGPCWVFSRSGPACAARAVAASRRSRRGRSAGAPDGSGAAGEMIDEGCPERRARERPARRPPDGNAGSANSPELGTRQASCSVGSSGRGRAAVYPGVLRESMARAGTARKRPREPRTREWRT